MLDKTLSDLSELFIHNTIEIGTLSAAWQSARIVDELPNGTLLYSATSCADCQSHTFIIHNQDVICTVCGKVSPPIGRTS